MLNVVIVVQVPAQGGINWGTAAQPAVSSSAAGGAFGHSAVAAPVSNSGWGNVPSSGMLPFQLPV